MGFGGLGGCYKCMKYTLVAFNIIVLLIGGAVLGLGIYIYVGDSGLADYAIIFGNKSYEVSVYLLIAIGSVTIIVSFLGCCGAIMESRCMLGIYFAIMLILSIFFIVITVLGFVFKDEISDEMKAAGKETWKEDYGTDKDITKAWDAFQKDLHCCGFTRDGTKDNSSTFYQNTEWKTSKPDQVVPKSCCIPDREQENCAKGRNDTIMYEEGCFDIVDELLHDNARIILGIGLGALFIMVIGAIFSICLCRQIGKEGYVV